MPDFEKTRAFITEEDMAQMTHLINQNPGKAIGVLNEIFNDRGWKIVIREILPEEQLTDDK